jgi:predicted nuclease with TOPRIM domain
LTATEVAKAHAEELAHKHLSDLDKVQSQLTATEVAKANAEELADCRLVEIDSLLLKVDLLEHDIESLEAELIKKNEQLKQIQISFGFKLLTALRLVPKRSIVNV